MALHGRNNCFINPAVLVDSSFMQPETQHMYVNVFQFLSSLTGSGEVERIAYYTGHVDSGSLGTGTDFYPSENQAGGNAFSVWRFASSSARPYDYYVLFQYAGSNTIPTTCFGNISGAYATYDKTYWTSGIRGGLGWQIAASYDTSTLIASNPWNGTTNNDGTDVKGYPTWQTGSIGEQLAVLPAFNNTLENKDGCGMFYVKGAGATAYQGSFDIGCITDTDNDGIWFLYTWTGYGNGGPPVTPYNDQIPFAFYLGTYFPRSELTGTVLPLIGFGGNASVTSLFTEGSNTKTRSGSAGVWLSSSAYNMFQNPSAGTITCFTPDRSPWTQNTFMSNAVEKNTIPVVATSSINGNDFGFIGKVSKFIGISTQPANTISGMQEGILATNTGASTRCIWFPRSSSAGDFYNRATSMSGSATY